MEARFEIIFLGFRFINIKTVCCGGQVSLVQNKAFLFDWQPTTCQHSGEARLHVPMTDD